jgi:DNA polymerase III subunit gamma/tau
MTAQVYYRKWRPQRLSDLVGQEPIVLTLKQAIVRDRVAHAYLLCGPRGTGKTSTARILAKAVNCYNQEEGEPCNSCEMCTSVNEGRAMDLLEIDAASNRGIDDIRNIREKVHYAPVAGKYKVYVLDEAHMLTDPAADAFLKTLEEPPAHVIFILATTEPHKLHGTLISRCQRFDFRRITSSAIVERLIQICAAEGIEAERSALHAMARNASGSLRDAENLLEQAVTTLGSPLGLEQVNTLMGFASEERIRSIVVHVLLGDTSKALNMVNKISAEGLDLSQVHRQMMEEIRDLLLIKSGATDMVMDYEKVFQAQKDLLGKISLERLLDTIRRMGRVVFRHDAPGTLSLELAVIESSHSQVGIITGSISKGALINVPEADLETKSGKDDVIEVIGSDVGIIPGSISSGALSDVPEAELETKSDKDDVIEVIGSDVDSVQIDDKQLDSYREERNKFSQTKLTESNVPGISDDQDVVRRLEAEWGGIVKTLSRIKGRRFNLGALLRACSGRILDGDTLTLEFLHESHMERMQEEIDNPDSFRQYREALHEAVGTTKVLNLVLITSGASHRPEKTSKSALLQAAMVMGGKILKETDNYQKNEDHDE